MEIQKKITNSIVYVKKSDIPKWTTKTMTFVEAKPKVSTAGGFVDYTFDFEGVEYHFPDWVLDVDDLIDKLGSNTDSWTDESVDIVNNTKDLVAVLESERAK